jgi:hypothetical protein
MGRFSGVFFRPARTGVLPLIARPALAGDLASTAGPRILNGLERAEACNTAGQVISHGKNPVEQRFRPRPPLYRAKPRRRHLWIRCWKG